MLDWYNLSELDQDRLCHDPDFDFKPYWKQLSSDQKFFIVCSNINYKINWEKLTDLEKDMVCRRPDFDYRKYWSDMTIHQRVTSIRKDFDYKKYWNDLDDLGKYTAALHIPDFDFENYEITKVYFDDICKNKKNFKYNWEKLSEKNKKDLLLSNRTFDPTGHEDELLELIKDNYQNQSNLLRKSLNIYWNTKDYDLLKVDLRYKKIIKMLLRSIEKIDQKKHNELVKGSKTSIMFFMKSYILDGDIAELIFPTERLKLLNYQVFMRGDKLKKILI